MLHGIANTHGVMWGVGMELRDGLAPSRLDKVAILCARFEKMEVWKPSPRFNRGVQACQEVSRRLSGAGGQRGSAADWRGERTSALHG